MLLAILVGGAILLFGIMSESLSFYLRSVIISFVLLCFVCGVLGRERKIGFGKAFFLSLLLSPLVGFIVTLNSVKIKEEEYKEKMLRVAENNVSSSSVADQLHKLNELRKDGVLTDEEFTMQKEKLLNT